MADDPNKQNKKHGPREKPDPHKKPVAAITKNLIGIGDPPRYYDKGKKNYQK